MNARVKRWLYGLGAAFIGGGAGAVTSGLTSMGIAPDKFNLADINGVLRLLGLMLANFIVSGMLNMFFYLKQAPLPEEATGNTDIITKPPTTTTP